MPRIPFAAALAALLVALPAHAQRDQPLARDSDATVLDSRVRELEAQIGQLLVQVEDMQRVRAAPEPAPEPAEMIGFTEEGGALVLEWGGSRIEVGSSGITLRGRELSLEADMEGTFEAGQSLLLKAAGAGKFEAGQSLDFKTTGAATLETASTLNLKGSTVKLNGGNQPIAHEGSEVSGVTASGTLQLGQVESGSSTVLVP